VTEHCSGAGVKQATVSDASVVTVPDVCLPLSRSEHISRGNLTVTVHGDGNLELCRKKLLQLLSICKNASSTRKRNCVLNGFRRPSVSFVNSKFYAFSEFYYTMEDILRMGGKYNSVRFQLAAQVCIVYTEYMHYAIKLSNLH